MLLAPMVITIHFYNHAGVATYPLAELIQVSQRKQVADRRCSKVGKLVVLLQQMFVLSFAAGGGATTVL